MVGPDLDAGPRLAADCQRHERDVPESAHADLGERSSRGQAAWRLDADIQHARSTGERVYARTQLGRVLRDPVAEGPRPIVHPETRIVTSRHQIQLRLVDLEPRISRFEHRVQQVRNRGGRCGARGSGAHPIGEVMTVKPHLGSRLPAP